jgi:hypothetical protein
VTRAPAVLRLRLPGARGGSNLSDFKFFEGSLSSYYVHKLEAGEVSDALSQREIEVLVWADGADIVIAPTRALSGGVFSLATPALGLVAEVTVDPDLVPWLTRLWPPADALTGSGFAVFCGQAADLGVSGPVVLDPAGVAAELRAGIGEDSLFADTCLSLLPSAPSSKAPELPPTLAGGVALEPLPIVATDAAIVTPACTSEEQLLGPACVTIDDDRVVVRAHDESSLWVVEQPESLLGLVAPGTSLVIHGFAPDTPITLRASAFDRNGERTLLTESISGAQAHAHLVINEVLANPRGPESVGEWIELVNDGTADAELGGLELRDSGASVVLPEATLGPGEFVLLAADGFAPDPEEDVPPAPGTRVITLPKLGQAGLANAGELLRLSDASGRVLSRFPALASPDPGVSIARRAPDSPDDDTSAFGAHARPGASPGAPNQLASEP